MILERLNPTIHSAAVYEKEGKRGDRIAYDCRLIFVLSGDVSVTVGNKKIAHMSTGSVLYIPAGSTYRLKGQYMRAAVFSFDLFDGDAKASAPVAPESFTTELCRGCDGFAPFDRVIHIADLESEYDSAERICEIFVESNGYARAKASAMLKLLLIRIAETADESALPARMTEMLDEYIREHVGEEITNTEIGAIFGYHPFYVSTVIKEKRGMTLRQYIISARLRIAKQLLKYTNKTVAEIAEETGFTDASYFTKTFKASVGETPKEWRAKFKDDYV